MKEHKVTWSFSALKKYKTCARKYHAETVLKLYPRTETEATRYGTELHKAFEEYLRDDVPLKDNSVRFKPMLDALKRVPGVLLCEHEMGLKRDLTPCAFADEDRWVRGIADVVILNEEKKKALVGDFKSGGAKYPDKSQLCLMALMLFAHYPWVEEVNGALLFVNHNVLLPNRYYRKDIDKLWKTWQDDVAKLEASYANDVWHANPNGLCRKWCPVSHCEHNGG